MPYKMGQVDDKGLKAMSYNHPMGHKKMTLRDAKSRVKSLIGNAKEKK